MRGSCDKGFSLLSTVIGMSVALFMIASISNYAMHGLSEVRRTDIIMSMIGLETKVLAAFSNENNFPTFQVKKALQQGDFDNVPPFPLLDLENKDLVVVPSPTNQESLVESGVDYFDLNLNKCSGWAEERCHFKLEVSMEMVAGSVSGSSTAGPPDWIPTGSYLENISPYAIWAFAYRIRLNPALELRIRNLGVTHNDPLKIVDHTLPLPNHYILIDDKLACEPGGVISGVDSAKGVANCIYPSDMCPGDNPLAKEVVVNNGEVGISCVGWKKIRCPANYVVYDFKPSLFDGGNPQNSGLGRCVYIGKDSEPLGAHPNCPDKYSLVGTNCVLDPSAKFKSIVVSGGG